MKILKRVQGLIGIVAVVVLAGCGGSGSTNYDLGSGAGGGTGITDSFSSPAEMGVGDIMPIELAGATEKIVDFAGVATSERFVLLVGNARKGGSGSTIQLSTDMVAPADDTAKAATIAEDADDDMAPQEVLSAWMRALEVELSVSEPMQVEASTAKAMDMAKAASVGEVRDFRMLNSLSSSTSYVTVNGAAKCVGAHAILYVDTRVTDELTDAEIATLCADFDGNIAEEQAILGALSDTDGDGKISIFMSPQVNMLGSMGGGIITGYFYAGDLYPRSSSNPVSNNGEIIYTMVPDPSGTWGVAITHEFAMNNLIPAVLVHEAQHAISYNQHVFLNNGAPEDPWLNEAISHFIEDLLGHNNENPSRVSMYLNATSSAGLVSSSSPNLIERGASYLFIRFLYEQHPDGNAFLAALENSNLTGVENLERAFAGSTDFQSFSQFMARWAVAMAMADTGLTSDPRYIYQARTRHPVTNNWQGVCLRCDADDGRGTVLEGPAMAPYYGYHSVPLDSSAVKYFEVATVPAQIVVQGNGDDGDFGVLIRTE